jgi:hypothetical protein
MSWHEPTEREPVHRREGRDAENESGNPRAARDAQADSDNRHRPPRPSRTDEHVLLVRQASELDSLSHVLKIGREY